MISCEEARRVITDYFLKIGVSEESYQEAMRHIEECKLCMAKASSLMMAIAGEEMECSEFRERLHELVALEMEGRDPLRLLPQIYQHAQSCPYCREEYLLLKALEGMEREGEITEGNIPEANLDFLAGERETKERIFRYGEEFIEKHHPDEREFFRVLRDFLKNKPLEFLKRLGGQQGPQPAMGLAFAGTGREVSPKVIASLAYTLTQSTELSPEQMAVMQDALVRLGFDQAFVKDVVDFLSDAITGETLNSGEPNLGRQSSMYSERTDLQKELEAKGLHDVTPYAISGLKEFLRHLQTKYNVGVPSLEEVREITGRVYREHGVTLSDEVRRMREE